MKINDKNFLYSLSHIRKTAFSFLENEMKKSGIEDISPSYGDILYALEKSGGASLKDICRMTNKDKSTVSLIVNSMEKSGWIVKRKDHRDSRAIHVSLSDKALQYADIMKEISNKLQKTMFKGMSGEEKSILFMLLDKVAKNF